MQQQQIKISQLKTNSGQINGLPKNPRLIKDDRFDKLIKSIQEDPEMLHLRELIVYPLNEDFVVIAGNMRLAAMKELKYKEAPCKVLDAATPVSKLKAYTIKDNVPFGENDWSELTENWSQDSLVDWGLTVPNWSLGVDENEMDEEDVDIEQEFDPVGVSAEQQRVVFIFDGPEDAESYLKSINIIEFSKRGEAWQVNRSTPSI